MEEHKCAYKLSKDYKRLKELLDNGYEVVCFADYNWEDGFVSRDICIGRFIKGSTKEHDHYTLSCRGIAYVECYPSWYKDRGNTDEEIFEIIVGRAHIEFIEPTIELHND